MAILGFISALMIGYAVLLTALWYIQIRRLRVKRAALDKALAEALDPQQDTAAKHTAQQSTANHTRLKEAPFKQQQVAALSAGSNAHELTNTMLESADAAQKLHRTFQKFVPRQFVEHFAKSSADDLSLGYADEDEVAIMFCDIRGFTGLSEQMSPQQLMNFLNAYFLRMNAPIHDNHGFIDKFIGDAIMALFDHPTGWAPDKASDSIKAALDIQKALRLYNHHRAKSGYPSVKNGTGLHIGPVIIGTVGSDDRMDTTVIGDTVNIAQRIESLTAHFGVEILASKKLVDEASQNMDFAHRYVDNVVLKGKSTSVELVEVYHHLSNDEIAARDKTKDAITQGIKLRNALKFTEALSVFNKAFAQTPDDPILKHHVHTCNKLMYDSEWDKQIRL